MSIEETLLEYHRITGRSQEYLIKVIDEIPDNIYDTRSVCINNQHVQFYEKIDLDKGKSIIYWKLDTVKAIEE
ncbi:MAG: hypothetical protein CL613_11235 [Aquimarina sp.]|nr:hypothetical protein [Aquimarina sp.]|tara:strand:- start:267 stop:485 length:219 start_codon:yes stop_codon:yes gene_type:complete